MKIFIMVLTLLTSCSTHKTSNHKYLNLYKKHKPQHLACIEHKKNVLLKPVTESEVADLDDEQYYFIRQEKEALKYIEAFDVTKFTLKENQLEFEAIVNECVVEKNTDHIPCDTLYPAFKFFRALIHGMNQYQWSSTTIQKAKSATISYLKYVAASESSMMDVLFANDLLARLSRRGYIPEGFEKEANSLRRKAEADYRQLMESLRKTGHKELSCQDAKSFYARERETVKRLSKELREALEKLP